MGHTCEIWVLTCISAVKASGPWVIINGHHDSHLLIPTIYLLANTSVAEPDHFCYLLTKCNVITLNGNNSIFGCRDTTVPPIYNQQVSLITLNCYLFMSPFLFHLLQLQCIFFTTSLNMIFNLKVPVVNVAMSVHSPVLMCS